MKKSFLTEKKLSNKIKHVCEGKKLRVAVAFLGKGAEKNLFKTKSREDVKIVCDISMGGTNPVELKEMGAPKNKNLRYLDGLHAKIYVSENGAVVGSANASSNGVGFSGHPTHFEAGMFVKQNTKLFKEIEDGFNKIWAESRKLDDDALKTAKDKFEKGHPEKPSVPKQVGKLTMNDLIDNPDAFGGLGIVMTHSVTPKKDHDRIASEQQSKEDGKKGKHSEYQPKNADDSFTGWGKQAKKFPPVCINLHGNGERKLMGPLYRIRGPFNDRVQGKCLFAYKLGWRENIEDFTQTEICSDPRVLKLARLLKKKGGSELYRNGDEFIKAVLKANE